jgi:hypothetical protein
MRVAPGNAYGMTVVAVKVLKPVLHTHVRSTVFEGLLVAVVVVASQVVQGTQVLAERKQGGVGNVVGWPVGNSVVGYPVGNAVGLLVPLVTRRFGSNVQEPL